MKRILCACCGVVLIFLFLSGCGKAPTPDEWNDLKEAADNYSLEDAKRNGYVVIADGDAVFGENIWQKFFNLSAKKRPCKIRVVHYYTLDDPSHYDPAYYESIKDDYPEMYISELVFSGEAFIVRHYEGEKYYGTEYKYLMKCEGEAESREATYTSYVRYVLVNDDTVTWNDIMHGMFSSQSGDYIPHRSIYTDLVFKE